jgi:ESCRT-I complex subunit VPS28
MGGDEDKEIRLFESSREREAYDEQANLYAILTATEHLERAYARDAISPKEYTEQCKKLISQFRLAERVLRGQMSTETFMQLYQMDCPQATERLLVQGVPEAIKGGSTDASHAVTVAETVQHFITTMDAVRLEQRAVDGKCAGGRESSTIIPCLPRLVASFHVAYTLFFVRSQSCSPSFRISAMP